ncbi:MAG: hypothetical protein OXG59_12045 [Gammaproteobacteria bacterium]|nr:hypothetical protein [Gammaproteobacteria bacterium]
MKKIPVCLLFLFAAGCMSWPDVQFLNQSGHDLELSSGDLSFRLNSMETSNDFKLYEFLKYPLQIKSAKCEVNYSADVPTPQTDFENASEAGKDWLLNYKRYSARVIISPTLELRLEITHKKNSSVHDVEAFGFPARPEKLDCTSDS